MIYFLGWMLREKLYNKYIFFDMSCLMCKVFICVGIRIFKIYFFYGERNCYIWK